MIRNSLNEYGSVSKILHWLIFFLVTFMLLSGYFSDDISNKATKHFIGNLHKVLGVLILLLMLLRLIWACFNPKPLTLVVTPLWQKSLERVTHLSIYMVLLAMPISGWIMSSAAGKAPYIGQWILKLPLTKNPVTTKMAFSFHNTLAIFILVLIGLHILAAFYHQFVKKDHLLQRML